MRMGASMNLLKKRGSDYKSLSIFDNQSSNLSKNILCFLHIRGPKRDRTADLLNANQALSQTEL